MYLFSLEYRTILWLVSQSCPTLHNPMDYIAHQAPLSMGILQARVPERVAMPSSRESSQPRDQIQVSCTAGRFFTIWATREAQEYWSGQPIPSPGDLPNPGIEPGSPALQADSLPAELPGKTILLGSKSSSNSFQSLNMIVLFFTDEYIDTKYEPFVTKRTILF